VIGERIGQSAIASAIPDRTGESPIASNDRRSHRRAGDLGGERPA
jgi:hypothetical protein